MAELVEKLGVKRESGRLYYIRGNEIWSSPMKSAGGGKAEMVKKGTFTREAGYLYFLDSDGNVSRSKMAKKGAKVEAPAKASKPAKAAKPVAVAKVESKPMKAAPKKSAK
jgi:hypothetical protein